MILTLPFPPSVNSYYRAPNKGAAQGRYLISQRGRQYRNEVKVAVVEQLRRLPTPITSDVRVDILVSRPDKRKRDLDNLQKALFDSLTFSRVWKDDSQIVDIRIKWAGVTKNGSVSIEIFEVEKVNG